MSVNGFSTLILGFLFSIPTYADSSCASQEVQALKSVVVVDQIVPSAKLYALDCAVIKNRQGEELLALVYILNAKSGLVSHLVTVPRKGVSVRSRLLFKSEILGLDSFPMDVAGQNRLLFVLPSSDPTTVIFYLNPQTGPSATKLSRWNYSVQEGTLTEDSSHSWSIDAGQRPKIHLVGKKWKADVRGHALEL